MPWANQDSAHGIRKTSDSSTRWPRSAWLHSTGRRKEAGMPKGPRHKSADRAKQARAQSEINQSCERASCNSRQGRRKEKALCWERQRRRANGRGVLHTTPHIFRDVPAPRRSPSQPANTSLTNHSPRTTLHRARHTRRKERKGQLSARASTSHHLPLSPRRERRHR